MTVERVVVASATVAHTDLADAAACDPLVERALTIGVLCNDATPAEAGEAATGDPVEVAMLEAGGLAGLERAALEHDTPRVQTTPFESDIAMMATEHRADDGFLTCVKGAPEAVLEHVDRILRPDGEAALDAETRGVWLARTERLAEDGLRVLAVAEKRTRSEGGDPYEDLVFIGLVGLHDPPRADVPDAIRACHDAGIRVVMITGDHAATARRIGASVGLAGEDAEVIEGRDLRSLDGMDEAEKRRLLAAPIGVVQAGKMVMARS